jgi:Right handed beta helix region
MKGSKRRSISKGRILVFGLTAAALLCGTGYVSNVNVSANHPVLVEGNCDSPVPGTTIVNIGQCGDYDGDGRIGTAEDTDGADRIFGTLKAALGPGTGAAAGTGANFNGTITIVRSGRFAEQLYIGQSGYFEGFPEYGTANPGNVTIEAAPGVHAEINAVLQGDPAGGNTARQASWGFYILYPQGTPSVVTLRNLSIRNFEEGVTVVLGSRVLIDNCRIENNRDYGVQVRDLAQVVIKNSTINNTGRRIPVSGPATPGHGLSVEGGNNAQARVYDSVFSNNVGAGIFNDHPAANVSLFKVATYFNGTDIQGAVTIAPDHNYAK